MKKLVILTFMWLSVSSLSAQVFWTEDFGTGCSQNNNANNTTTTNGTWVVSSTGTNDPQANEFYISATEAGMGAGNCGDGCLGNASLTNRSLHVANIAGSPASLLCSTGDCGAAYDATVTTNKRAESPTINCTGFSNITISFNYIMYGEVSGTGSDQAYLAYFDGTTWTDLVALPQTTCCGGPCTGITAQGNWTNYTYTLPPSANNNPNVKIGFRWTNDNNNQGADPSFAVDDITLSVVSSSPLPTASFVPSATTICVGDNITFTDNSTGTNITTWNWTFNGGTPSSANTQGPHTVTFNTAGTYNITLQVTDANGTDDTTIAITVNPLPTVTANASPGTSVCQGDAVTLTGSGASSYTWDNGVTDGVSFTPTTTTTYTVTGTDANGCSNTDQITITVNNCTQPTASFVPSATTVCVGDSITFTDNSTGINITTWNWTFNGGTPSSANTQGPHTVTFNTSGTYNITLQVTDANGTDDTTIVVTVTSCALPVASIGYTSTTICENQCITFTDNSTGGVTSWSWVFDGGTPATSTQQDPGQVCWNTSGTYNVVLITTNNMGSDTDTVVVTVNPLPSLSVSNDTTISLGGQAGLTAMGTPPGGTYVWNPDTYLDCNTCSSVTSTAEENITYTVLYADTNGCQVTGQVSVMVDVEVAIGVPNAFSPNGDGNNDVLYVKGNGINQLTFVVYNRYGQKVFEATDISQGWDGTFKGKPENPGVFVYYLNVIFKDFSSKKLKGEITLIR